MLTGVCLLAIRSDRLRRCLVIAVTALLVAASIALAIKLAPNDLTALKFDPQVIGHVMEALEVAMAGFVIYIGLRRGRPLIAALMLGQFALMAWFGFQHGDGLQVERQLLVDRFSIIMALIIGITGGLICLYALGYMREFHEDYHPEIQDRRPFFFSLLFVFLGAMFGVVFANNLMWLFMCWEATTLCSFVMIGYPKTEEATRNAFRALGLNLLGGLGFVIAIFYLLKTGDRTIELDKVLAGGVIDPHLPADAAVNLGEERRGDLDKSDAAQHRGGEVPGEITDDPAAECERRGKRAHE